MVIAFDRYLFYLLAYSVLILTLVIKIKRRYISMYAMTYGIFGKKQLNLNRTHVF